LTRTTVKKSVAADLRFSEMRRALRVQHRLKVVSAQDTYQELMSALMEVDFVIEVLDARDPSSCRLLEAEGTCAGTKPLLIVLNKIDLVPRESVLQWLQFLRGTAPTVALSAVTAEAADALRAAVDAVAPQARSCAVIGVRGVGKSTLCAMNAGFLREVRSYAFLRPTSEMGLLRGADYVDPDWDLAVEILARSPGESLFVALGMPVQDSPAAVLAELGRRWQIKPRAAATRLLERIWSGALRFYAAPPDAGEPALTPVEGAAIQASRPAEMSTTDFITLEAGEALEIDEQALATTAAEIGDEEEEDGAEVEATA